MGARGQLLLRRQNPNGSPPRRIPLWAVLGTAGALALSLAPLGFTCGLGLGGRAAVFRLVGKSGRRRLAMTKPWACPGLEEEQEVTAEMALATPSSQTWMQKSQWSG